MLIIWKPKNASIVTKSCLNFYCFPDSWSTSTKTSAIVKLVVFWNWQDARNHVSTTSIRLFLDPPTLVLNMVIISSSPSEPYPAWLQLKLRCWFTLGPKLQKSFKYYQFDKYLKDNFGIFRSIFEDDFNTTVHLQS